MGMPQLLQRLCRLLIVDLLKIVLSWDSELRTVDVPKQNQGSGQLARYRYW